MAEYAAALLIELPQREIGGRLPAWDDLVAQTALARSHGTATHLDGARLLESLPFYGRPAAEVAALFDSVYLSLYKGLGGISGCLLAGDEQLVAEAREWRHRHGGTLFELWPYAAAGLAGLRLRAARMPAYVEHAQGDRGRARRPWTACCSCPDPPLTPMMHVYLRGEADRLRRGDPPDRGRARPVDLAEDLHHRAAGLAGGRALGGRRDDGVHAGRGAGAGG